MTVQTAPALPVALPELFSPRSIAVVGASTDPRGYGGAVVRNLVRHGFAGRVFPVNPKYDEVDGLPCFPSVDAIPDSVDLAVLLIPQRVINDVLTQCAAKGVSLAVVVTAGYGEAGPSGRAAQDELVRHARTLGIRLIGPNCLGFLNVTDNVAAAATWVLDVPELRKGGVSLVCHSGGLTFASTLMRGMDRGCGFRYVFNTGNEADLGVAELLEVLVTDPGTTAIGLQVETIRDPAAFRAAAAAAADVGKPVVVLKVGESEPGQRAAASHTGAVAGDAAVHRAVFAADGIVRAEDIDDLWALPAFLSAMPRATGRRVTVVTSTGGTNGLIADQLYRAGLELPGISPSLSARLREFLPEAALVSNPMDLSGVVGLEGTQSFRRVLECLDEDDETDLVLLALVPVHRDFDHEMRPMVELLQRMRKPVAILGTGGSVSQDGMRALTEGGVVVFDEPRQAADALRALVDYSTFLSDRRPAGPSDSDVRDEAPLTLAPGASQAEALNAFAQFGLTVPAALTVHAESDLAEAEAIVGFPMAVKIDQPGLLHKSDADGVILGVGDPSALVDAFRSLRRRFGESPVLLQRMAPSGLEMFVGFKVDPHFGPVVVVGVGGIFVEIVKDVQLIPLPANAVDIERALRRLQAWPLLDGARGSAHRDVPALVQAIEGLAAMAPALARAGVESVDLNPVIVYQRGKGACVVDAKAVWKAE